MTEEIAPPKRRGRGPGKKPPLFVTSLRISQEIKEFFDKNYPKSKQAKMREVLTEFVRSQNQGANDGSHE